MEKHDAKFYLTKEYQDMILSIGEDMAKRGVPGMKNRKNQINRSAVIQTLIQNEMDRINVGEKVTVAGS